MTAEEIDKAVAEQLREFRVPYTLHTRVVARKMAARLRHAGLLRQGVIKTERPPIQFEPD